MTATNDTKATTSQELLDQLVEQGYPADSVTETIERMVALGCIEHSADDELELILTDDEARVIRSQVTGEPDRPAATTTAYEEGRADAAALGFDYPAALAEEPQVAEWVDDALAEWTQDPTVYASEGSVDPFVTACPPWCEYQPHGFTNCVEDKWHSSYTCSVPLELEPAQQSSQGESGQLSYESETAVAYIKQGYREIAPYIFIGKGEAAGMYLTLDETERFARALLALIEVGRKGSETAR